jgi:hypothetical protein
MMNKMTTLRSLVFALLALHAAASEACRVPPARQLIAPGEQLALAMDVAVGQVIGATPLGDHLVEYRFLTLEQLAGQAQKVFTVMGGPAAPSDKDTSFHNHADFAFWARGGGRTMNGADCVIRPGFVVGNSYLVFLGPAPTWRSFEKIEMIAGHPDPDDKWLAYVKTALGGVAAKRDGAPDYERVGRFLYGFQRSISQARLDPESLAAQHAPDELQARARRLGDEFFRIVESGVQVPDAALEATLREAAEVNAAVAAWRAGADR